jgi:ABC-type multidrug transport system permease subunit
MRDIVTTLVDLLGLLAVAVGLGFAASLLIGPAAIAVSGAILLLGVRIMGWVAFPGTAPSWWRWLRKGGRT